MFGFGRHFDSLFPRSFFDHEMQMIDDFIDRDHDLFSAPLQPLWPSSFLALQPLPSSSSSSTQSSSSTTTSSTDSSSSSSSSDSSKQLAQQQDTQQSSNSLLSWRPSLKPIRVDVLDQKDKIVVKAEVPGLPKEQIKLNIDENNVLTISGKHSEEKKEVPGLPKEQIKLNIDENNVLTISGKHSEEKKEEKPNFVRHECSYGEVRRSLRLPKNIDAKKVSAKYENGVLLVEVPKTEEVKPMDIVIG
eukprot:TRINITY_DN976_c0_g1_i8.p1 TRINITY_DN976_c0_g1~~TRINITY_DN976_c0_g1_i8.p1  ORF type:complete len:246 (-),score=106.27 TRINITY_DN976_c0_g1_i8:35-772(-)